MYNNLQDAFVLLKKQIKVRKMLLENQTEIL